MTRQNTALQLMEVAQRIREMRTIMNLSAGEMAEKTGISEYLYREYEAGSTDLPFTFMHKCAQVFGIELTDLL